MLMLALAAIASWALSVIIHEACHILTALLLGWRGRISLSFNHGLDSPVAASCALPGLGSHPRTEILVRHAGWVGSTLVALGITFVLGWSAVGGIALDGPERVLVACRQQDLRAGSKLSLSFLT